MKEFVKEFIVIALILFVVIYPTYMIIRLNRTIDRMQSLIGEYNKAVDSTSQKTAREVVLMLNEAYSEIKVIEPE